MFATKIMGIPWNIGAYPWRRPCVDWLQQFVKDAGEFAGAHILSMVCAHHPLVDLSRLEKGYPKEVGP